MSDETLEKARSRIPNFSMLKWMSFGNGLLRPACASFRDIANRIFTKLYLFANFVGDVEVIDFFVVLIRAQTCD